MYLTQEMMGLWADLITDRPKTCVLFL